MTSWDIESKTVESLTIGNKQVQSIVRTDNDDIIYEAILYTINFTANKQTVNIGDTVTFTMTVHDFYDDPVTGEPVVFSDGTSTLDTVNTNNNGIASFTYTTNAIGSKTIYATIGNYTSSISINVTKITTNITIDVPLVLTYSDAFNISGTLTDSSSNALNGKTVELLVGDTVVDSTTTSSNGGFSFTQTPVSMGTHSFKTHFASDSNYLEAISSTVTRDINKETSVLSVSSPSNNAIVNPESDLSISGTLVTDDNEKISGASIVVSQGNSTVTTLTTNSNGEFSGTVSGSNVSEGTLTFSYAATTYYTASSVDRTITTKINPTLSITRSAESINLGGTVTISGTLSAGTGQSVKIYCDNSLLDTVTTTTDGAYSKVVSGLGVGSHSFYAVYDGNSTYNNITSSSTSVTVNKGTPSLTSGISSGSIVVGNSVTISGNLSYGGAALNGVSIKIYQGNSLLDTVTTDSSGNYSKSTTINSSGTFSFYASFEGNSNYNSASSGTVSTTAKYNSSITVGCNTGSTNPGAYVTASGYLTSGSGLNGQTVYIYCGGTYKGSCTTNSSGYYSFGFYLNNSTGSQTIQAVYSETISYYGTNASTSVTTKYNSSTSISSNTYSTAPSASVTISGSTTSSGYVYIYENGSYKAAVYSNGSYSTTITLTSATGTHTIRADYNGNGSYYGSQASTNITAKYSPSLSISASSNSIGIGSSVTLSGTLSAGSGSVKIYDGNTLITTVNAGSNGAYATSITPSSVGTHTYHAVFDGNSSYYGVTSGDTSVSVNKLSSTISISASSSSINTGSSVTLSGTVSAGSGQTVTIYEGSTAVATITSGTNGTYSTSITPSVGSHTYYASYGGNGTYNGSTSGNTSVTVNKLTSTVSISANSNSINIGSSVTLSGTLSAGSGQTVTIYEGSTAITTATTGSNGAYSVSVTPSSVGSHSYTAGWGGNGTYNGCSSSATSITVNKLSSTITIGANSSSINIGSSVTLSGTLSVGSGQTITIYEGSSSITTTTSGTNGAYSVSITPSSTGSHSYTASWGGNGTYNGCSSSATSVTVNKLNPTLSLSASSNSINAGGSVTLSGNLSVGSGQSVTIKEGSTTIATVTTGSNGAFSTSISPSAGSHTYTASWEGNSTYNSVTSGNASVTVNKLTPTLNCIADISPVYAGDSVGIIGQLSIGQGKSIKLYQNNTLVATLTTGSKGRYTYTINNIAAGSYSFKAIYEGDSTYNSVEASFTLTVEKRTPTISLSANSSSIDAGGSVTLSGTLSVSGQSVTIKEGGTTIATVTTESNGTFSTSISPSAGSHTYTASWAGNSTYNSVTSSNVSVTVNKITPTITISSSSSSTTPAATVTVSGSLKKGSNGINTATITIYDGTTNKGTCTTNSTGTYAKSIQLNNSAGTHTLKAESSSTDIYNSVNATTNVTAKYNTTLSISASSNSINSGSSVTLSGTLSAPGRDIAIYEGSTVVATTMSDSNGAYSVSITPSEGSHTYYANFSGDPTYYGSSSGDTTVTVISKTTPTISFSADTNEILVVNSVTFSGTLSAGSGQSVKIYKDNSLLTTVTTGTNGAFSYTENGSIAAIGAHNYYAQFDGNTTYNAVQSSTVSVSRKYNSSLTISANPSTISLGNSTTISGQLSNEANAQVKIYEGNTLITTTTTDSSSNYSVSITPSSTGYHTYHAVYDGSSTTFGSTSSDKTINVVAAAKQSTQFVNCSASVISGAYYKYQGTLQTTGGVAIANVSVTLTIGSKSYSRTTNSSGTFSYVATLDTASVSFAGNDTYEGCSYTF